MAGIFVTAIAGLCLAGIVTLLVGLSLYRMEHSSALVKATLINSAVDMADENNDGANDNDSWNCGVEGPSDDPEIEALRTQQKGRG